MAVRAGYVGQDRDPIVVVLGDRAFLWHVAVLKDVFDDGAVAVKSGRPRDVDGFGSG